MQTVVRSAVALAMLLVNAAWRTDKAAAVVERLVVLDSLPSGSGMASWGDSVYIAGDDASNVYKLSLQNGGYRRIPLSGMGTALRVPRRIKPDYEAAITAPVARRECLLLFGSGSSSPHRDSLLIMRLDAEQLQQRVSLRPLYADLCRAARLKRSQLNIEAVFASGDRLYLFNRGSNHIFSIPYDTFLAQAGRQAVTTDDIRVDSISLPEWQGVPAGFSGATGWGASGVLFSASLEATTSTTTDGPILGSYIGALQRQPSGVLTLQWLAPVVLADNQPYTGKIESVLPLGQKGQTLRVAAVADNDDGRTQLLMLRLHVPD